MMDVPINLYCESEGDPPPTPHEWAAAEQELASSLSLIHLQLEQTCQNPLVVVSSLIPHSM